MSVEHQHPLQKCLSTNRGTFTIVYQFQPINDARKYAIRFLNNALLRQQFPPDKQKELLDIFTAECRQLLELNLSHVNIVQHVNMYSDVSNGPGLIMELMDMPLTLYLHNSENTPAFQIQIGLSHDIAQALAFLHQKGIIHQNLTAKSVFLMHDSHTNVPLAKVGDFGMTKFIQSTGLCTEVPSMKFDILSFGALVAEIMTKQHVHVSAVEQINSIISLLDNPLVSIVKCCFQEDCLTADILTMRIAKQAIAYTCKRVQEQEAAIQDLRVQSFQVQPQILESTHDLLQRSCDAVIDRVRNIIYLRKGKDKKLLVFNLNHNAWEYYPNCNLMQCALALFQGNLLAIGGAETDKSPRSRDVYKLVEDMQSKTWENTLTPLKTARGRSTALVCKFDNDNFLIVAGGETLRNAGNPNSGFESLSDVEIYTEQGWHSASELPGILCCASGTVVKDYVCLLGGWSKRDNEIVSVYTCQLSELVGTLDTPWIQVWSQVKPPCPVAQTTCITFQDKLLIVGGTIPDDPKKTPVDAIHIYNEHTNRWDIVGHLPAPRYLCYAQAICKCRIIVIAGCKDSSSASDDVHIFELK